MRLGIGLGLFKAGLISAGVRIFSAFQTRVIGDGGTVEAGTCVVNSINGSALLQQASLLLIPSGYKANKLYSEIPTNGNGDLTWTRASTAIRTNSSGLLESMGSGVPRLSYMYGSCPAALLEPQRTNLALRSEEFDNSAWQKSNVTVTANTTTSPDENTTADTISITSNNGYIRLFPLTFANSTTYTCAVFVKNNGISAGQTFNFYATNNLSSPNAAMANAIIDINNGSVTTSSSGSGVSAVSASISSLTNGWYRVQLTFTVGASAGGSICEIGFIASTATRTFFAWGAQLEVGAYPTTYIPTTSATATRIADSFSRSNIYTNGLITSSGGTWFVELRRNLNYVRDSGGFGISLANNNTTYDFGFLILTNAGGAQRISILKRVSGIGTSIYTTTTDTTKIAIKWNGSTADVFANGTKVVTATSFTTTQMELLTANILDTPKFIQQMALFPTPLSDTDCTTITSI